MNRGRALQIKRAKIRRGRRLFGTTRLSKIISVTVSLAPAPDWLKRSALVLAYDAARLVIEEDHEPSDAELLASRLFFAGVTGDATLYGSVEAVTGVLTKADKAERKSPTVFVSFPAPYDGAPS